MPRSHLPFVAMSTPTPTMTSHDPGLVGRAAAQCEPGRNHQFYNEMHVGTAVRATSPLPLALSTHTRTRHASKDPTPESTEIGRVPTPQSTEIVPHLSLLLRTQTQVQAIFISVNGRSHQVFVPLSAPMETLPHPGQPNYKMGVVYLNDPSRTLASYGVTPGATLEWMGGGLRGGMPSVRDAPAALCAASRAARVCGAANSGRVIRPGYRRMPCSSRPHHPAISSSTAWWVASSWEAILRHLSSRWRCCRPSWPPRKHSS